MARRLERLGERNLGQIGQAASEIGEEGRALKLTMLAVIKALALRCGGGSITLSHEDIAEAMGRSLQMGPSDVDPRAILLVLEDAPEPEPAPESEDAPATVLD
jgi:hypothetical protein